MKLAFWQLKFLTWDLCGWFSSSFFGWPIKIFGRNKQHNQQQTTTTTNDDNLHFHSHFLLHRQQHQQTIISIKVNDGCDIPKLQKYPFPFFFNFKKGKLQSTQKNKEETFCSFYLFTLFTLFSTFQKSMFAMSRWHDGWCSHTDTRSHSLSFFLTS